MQPRSSPCWVSVTKVAPGSCKFRQVDRYRSPAAWPKRAAMALRAQDQQGGAEVSHGSASVKAKAA